MSSQRARRRMWSLFLALSVALWAQCGLAMLSAASAPRCHVQMLPMQHGAAPMPCCPSQRASVATHFSEPPPCCDLSNTPTRPVASAVMPGKSRSGQFSANGDLVKSSSPQRLKPALKMAHGGTAEAVPFQNRGGQQSEHFNPPLSWRRWRYAVALVSRRTARSALTEF